MFGRYQTSLPAAHMSYSHSTLLALALMSLSGCAHRPIATTRAHPALSTQIVRSIAVLPIQNRRVTPEENRDMSTRFISAFAARNPTIEIVKPADAVALLNNASLAQRYTMFLRDYTITDIPDKPLLSDVGKALRADAIAQGAVVEIIQRNGFFNIQPGMTQVTVRYRIISTSTGALLWEGMGSASRTTLTDLEKAPTLHHQLAIAQQAILDTLPRLHSH